MKERPILFKAPMVQAILSGRKTQTRRVVKLPRGCSWYEGLGGERDGWWEDGARPQGWWHVSEMRCPYGQPGDRLWVREKFQSILAPGVEFGDANWKTGVGYAIGYPATDGIQEIIDEDDNITANCKPSIHMPRWASRILLEVASVRVEPLQDISEVDAIAEGMLSLRNQAWDRQHFPVWRYQFEEAVAKDERPPLGPSPKQCYEALWKSIHGPNAWDANPWVWVVEFKQIRGAA